MLRGIDHMAAVNHKIILGREESRGSGEHRGDNGASAKKLAAGWVLDGGHFSFLILFKYHLFG
jgi:hypothetical protein